MTRGRYEIDLQGSNDGEPWVAYPFRFKPQDLSKRLQGSTLRISRDLIGTSGLHPWVMARISDCAEDRGESVVRRPLGCAGAVCGESICEAAAEASARRSLAVLVYNPGGRSDRAAAGGAANLCPCTRLLSSANRMALSVASSGLRLRHTSECRQALLRW